MTIAEMDEKIFEYCKGINDCAAGCKLFDKVEFCRRSPKRVRENFEYLVKIGEIASPTANPKTKCWKCAKASGGCAWSDGFKPVKGWFAFPTIRREGKTVTESYYIADCPEFEKDKGFTAEDITDDGAIGVVAALVKQTARDYRRLLDRQDVMKRGRSTKKEREDIQFEIYKCEYLLPADMIRRIKKERGRRTRNEGNT